MLASSIFPSLLRPFLVRSARASGASHNSIPTRNYLISNPIKRLYRVPNPHLAIFCPLYAQIHQLLPIYNFRLPVVSSCFNWTASLHRTAPHITFKTSLIGSFCIINSHQLRMFLRFLTTYLRVLPNTEKLTTHFIFLKWQNPGTMTKCFTISQRVCNICNCLPRIEAPVTNWRSAFTIVRV